MRLCRLWGKFVERKITRASVTRHSPRVFLATRAREVCYERPLNHNRNGGRIALRPKCTSGSGGGFLFAFARFRGRGRHRPRWRSMEFSALIRFFFLLCAVAIRFRISRKGPINDSEWYEITECFQMLKKEIYSCEVFLHLSAYFSGILSIISAIFWCQNK